MRNFKSIFAAIAAMLLFAACDPACTIEWVMVNHSGHNVRIIRYSARYGDALGADGSGTVEHVTDLKDGDSLLIETYHELGGTDRYFSAYMVQDYYWHDSVRFVFDDSTCCSFVPVRDTAWGPFGFNTPSYAYQEKANEGLTFRGMVLWSRLTYTLTPDDYDRCR